MNTLHRYVKNITVLVPELPWQRHRCIPMCISLTLSHKYHGPFGHIQW